jgi:hypothetical protein
MPKIANEVKDSRNDALNSSQKLNQRSRHDSLEAADNPFRRSIIGSPEKSAAGAGP